MNATHIKSEYMQDNSFIHKNYLGSMEPLLGGKNVSFWLM